MKNNRRIKRLLIFLGVLLIAYFNINMKMNYEISRELNKAKKDGEITTLSELVKERLHGDNRATLYLAAGELVELKGYPGWNEDFAKYCENNKEQVCTDLEKNQTVLDLMDKVSTKGGCNFDLQYEKGCDMPVPNYLKIRAIAYLLAMKAMNDIEKGNYDQAAVRCSECLALGRDLTGEGVLIQQMIAIAVMQIGMKPLDYMIQKHISANYSPVINELSAIKSSGFNNFIKSLEAERASGVSLYNTIKCRAVIPELLNVKDNIFALTLCYTLGYDTKENIQKEKSVDLFYLMAYLAKPYLLADELNYIRYMNRLISKIKKDPTAELKCEKISRYYIISSMLIPNLSKALTQEQNTLKDCDRLINSLQ